MGIGGSKGGDSGGGKAIPVYQAPVQEVDYTAMYEEMLGGMMENMAAATAASNKASADAAAQSQVDYGASLAEQQRQEGIADRDAQYSNYMDAASAATDYINTEITQNQSNARLSGADYSVTDEQKSKMINDYFATIWGAGEQASLETAIETYGNPQGFTGFTVTRGDDSVYSKTSTATETSKGVTTGAKTIATEDEEATLGAKQNILG